MNPGSQNDQGVIWFDCVPGYAAWVTQWGEVHYQNGNTGFVWEEGCVWYPDPNDGDIWEDEWCDANAYCGPGEVRLISILKLLFSPMRAGSLRAVSRAGRKTMKSCQLLNQLLGFELPSKFY